jgi:hypothetical protein
LCGKHEHEPIDTLIDQANPYGTVSENRTHSSSPGNILPARSLISLVASNTAAGTLFHPTGCSAAGSEGMGATGPYPARKV